MSKNRQFAAAIVVFSAFTFAAAMTSAAPAQGRGQQKKADKKADKIEKKADKAEDKRDKAEDKRDKKDDGRKDQVVVVDRDGHTRVIREYARASLPPGLAKRESLPPGLRQQLRERGELPPGLQKRLVPMPATWASRLPPVPSHYHRYFAGDEFIVVDTRTNRIVAIVRDVLQ